MVGLADRRDGLVVGQQVLAARLGVILLLLADHIGAGGDVVVVELEDTRDVDAVRAGHAVLAARAGHQRVLDHLVGNVNQELFAFVIQRLEVQEGLQVVLQVLHVGHARQGAHHARETAHVAEGPGGDGALGLPRLELVAQLRGDLRQGAAAQRLHDHDGNLPFVQLGVEVVGAGVASAGMLPVHVVHLDLHEVPVVLLVQGHHVVEALLVAVEGETEVADAARLALLHEEVHDAAVLEAVLEILAVTDGVQQVVVDVVGLEDLQRAAVHLHAVLEGGWPEHGQLGGQEPLLAGIAVQRLGRGPFAVAAQVDRGGVEIVDAMFDGEVHQAVDFLLVDMVLTVLALDHRPAHAAVAQGADALIIVEHLSVEVFVTAGTGFLGGTGCAGGHADRSGAQACRFQEFSSVHRAMRWCGGWNCRAR